MSGAVLQGRFLIPRLQCGLGEIILLEDRQLLRALPAGSSPRGMLNIFVRGSSAALSVNENCDFTVRSDLAQAMQHILPCVGLDPLLAAQTRALLMSSSLTLPVSGGKVCLGTWQGIYLARLRADTEVELVVTFLGCGVQAEFSFNANRRQSHVVDSQVAQLLPADSGTLLLHEKHTSASVSLAGVDLEPAMKEVVPEQWNDEFFQHTFEGPDDMPGHVKSTLLGCSVTVPTTARGPLLDGGQQLMLNEHRDVGGWGCGHTRRLVVTHKRGAEVLLEISRDGSGFVDITDTVRASVSEMVCGSVVGPGVVFVFASSASQAIFVAEHPAASEFTKSLSSVTQNARARAAIAKNGPAVPFSDGELLLVDGQRLWLYDAEPASSLAGVVLTLHM